MLWASALILIILWLLGLAIGDMMGYFIHIPLFFAIIAMLIQIEDDCSDYGSDFTRQRYLKKQLIRKSRNILPKIAILSGENCSQASISPLTYNKE